MKKLNARKLLFLPKDKYHDGDGLYISISSPGKGKWSFRYTINKKSREMGLGKFPDVSLLEARQHALINKQLLREKIDPIYDKYGNIVGVVVAQLNKFKMGKAIGSLPENVNFGIKASTVKQFLNESIPPRWSERTKEISTTKLSEIAKKQTVMVVCHR